MAVYNDWTVEYKNGATWTEIPNVQELSCSVGRQMPLETWPVSSASIRVWYPNGYASPLANFGAGTKIRISAPGRAANKPMWTGYVKNATFDIGIPWDSATSTGNADFLNIECEGAGAVVGRSEQVTIAGLAASTNDVEDLIKQLNASNSLPVGYDTTDPSFGIRQWSAGLTGWTEYPWTILQNTAVYGLWRLLCGVRKTWSWVNSAGDTDDPAVYLSASPDVAKPVATASFSDTANSATARLYDQVSFDGMADVYATRAALTYYYTTTAAYLTEIATNGSAPWRTYAANLLPQNILTRGVFTYIDETAAWYANAFADQLPTISTISATTNGQHTQNLDNLGVTDLELGMLPAYTVNVTLRGTTQLCQIEGVTVTADQEQARYTYYLSPAGDTAWFILDNSNYGVLDQNRLGVF